MAIQAFDIVRIRVHQTYYYGAVVEWSDQQVHVLWETDELSWVLLHRLEVFYPCSNVSLQTRPGSMATN